MCIRPVESNAGVGDCNRAAQKAPEGNDRQTHNQSIIQIVTDDEVNI